MGWVLKDHLGPDNRWVAELVLASGERKNGTNDMPGGVLVDPGPSGNGILLTDIVFRTLSGAVAGTGVLEIGIFMGDVEGNMGTNIFTGGLNVGQFAAAFTTPSPVAVAAYRVLRPSVAINATTGVGLSVQLRGTYAR